MKAFEVQINGKAHDYRIGERLNLEEVKQFFGKKYTVISLTQAGRHVTGILEKNDQKFFLKLATTEGISEVTRTEYVWNNEFNKHIPRDTSEFYVPINYESGMYKENLFYMITDFFEGNLFADTPHPGRLQASFKHYLPQIIEFAEMIQDLSISPTSERDTSDYQTFLLEKTQSWFVGIPEDVRVAHEVDKLFSLVQTNYKELKPATRHGDFTPWHLMLLSNGKLGLIDGEHAMKNGVRYYDIAYLIQRVYSVLKEPEITKEVLALLKEKQYDMKSLQTVLAARAIGGFLDESLAPIPDYSTHKHFMNMVFKPST